MTEHTIHTNAALLALALHGASVLGLTIEAALTSTPDALSEKLAALAAERKAAAAERKAAERKAAELAERSAAAKAAAFACAARFSGKS